LFLFGFMASFTAVQSAVSRCIWANARDRVLPGHVLLIRVTRNERLPYNAILVTAVIAAGLQFITASKIYTVLINFTNMGFYAAFALPVLGAAYVRLRGGWTAGPWSLGRWGNLITYIASAWLIAEIVNIAWPRASLYGTGVLQWSVLLMTGILGAAGVALNLWVFRDAGRHTRQGELIIAEDDQTAGT
jgi:amino acid transporter